MIAFIGKSNQAKVITIVKTLKNSQNIPAYQYLLLMSEWSKVTLTEAVNAKVINKVAPTLSTSAKFESASFVKENTNSIRNLGSESPQQNNQNQTKMMFFSREHLLSYIKAELMNVYSSLSSCIDVDMEYMNRLARPKKATSTKYLQEMIAHLIKYSNSHTALQIG